jgi:hypothetical protein
LDDTGTATHANSTPLYESPSQYLDVQVSTGAVYATATFLVSGGRSSCPVEPFTAARDGVKMDQNLITFKGIKSDGTKLATLLLGQVCMDVC